jgi:hypothetical protein
LRRNWEEKAPGITETFFHRPLVQIKARLVRDAEKAEIRFSFAGERRQMKKALFAFRPLNGKQKMFFSAPFATLR